MKQYYFKTPFGDAGDRVDITRNANSDGTVSYAQGWGPDYQKDLKTQANAKAVSRQVTNQLFWALTGAVQQYQQRGVPEWIAPADNDGTAFPYSAGTTVVLNGAFWVSLVDNNTTQPGTGTNWQSLIYKVATQSMVSDGTDSQSIVTPATLKADSDARIKTVNTSIADLTKTVAANKKAQEDGDTDLSKTIAANKQATDKSIQTIQAYTVNGYGISTNPVLTAGDVSAIPLTGTNKQSGTIEMVAGTGAQILPDNYDNFQERYGAKISQGDNGYWRDENTGFTIVWGIINTSANNDYSTVNFHRAFTTCFSVTCDVYGSQGTSETSDKNPIIKGWTGTGFTVYAGEVEKQMCYQAFGYSAA